MGKHTINFKSSSICLAFIQFEPKNMLNPMLNKEIIETFIVTAIFI